ncbi:MAG: hypothetical protein BWY89_01930 [Bacteroidetes bacterium ADurb.BinA012]|nr:MAG: hypothetical protein BWY89_01930 [Bacteroidetes bacterium ADurb.BinA012]
MAYGTEFSVPVFSAVGMACILYNIKVVPGGNFHDLIHGTCIPREMDRNDGFCPGCNGFFNFVRINIICVRINIHEDRNAVHLNHYRCCCYE